MEIWKEILGHENYEITSSGKIRRKKNGKELKPYISDRGYYTVTLWNPKEKTKKIMKVGKLVWQTFNDCECKKTIDHIDRNKTNDVLSNLRCISNKDNSNNKDIYKSVNKYNLDENKKKEIITNLMNGTWTMTKIFKLFGIPSNYMVVVKKRGSWNYLLNDENGVR